MINISKADMIDFESLSFEKDKCVNVSDCLYLPPDRELSRYTKTPISILEKYDNWIYTSGDVYYYKMIDSLQKLFSELLGEAVSRYMSVPTISYKVALDEDRVTGLVSKSFKDENLDYFSVFELSRDELVELRRLLKSMKTSNGKLKKEFANYLLSNFYMALLDRFANTLVCKNSEGAFNIAPVFDYESGFINTSMDLYQDPLITIRFDQESISNLLKNNQYAKYAVEKLLSMNIDDLFSYIETNKGIVIPDIFKTYYETFDKERKDYVKTLGLK